MNRCMNAITVAAHYAYYGTANEPFSKVEVEEKEGESSNSSKKVENNSTWKKKSTIEKLSDFGLIPLDRVTKFGYNLATKPRWISAALSLGGLYATVNFFYPNAINSLKKHICSLLSKLPKETAQVTAFVFTVLTIVSLGARSFSRYSNEKFKKAVTERINGLKEKQEKALNDKEEVVLAKEYMSAQIKMMRNFASQDK